jgi:Ca-activated chloride channel family protein
MLDSPLLEHFHFLRPWWGLLVLPSLLLLLQQWRGRGEAASWETVIAPHLLQALRIRQFRNHWFNPMTAGVFFMLLVTVVLMGPSWRQQASPLTRDEAALVILLDVSESMQSRDLQPSRLARARQKISDLLELRDGSRTALVVFSGSAHTVLNLTDDAQILNQYLAAIKPGIMPRSGKFAEYGLPLVDTVIGQRRVPVTVLLVSDGVSSATDTRFANYFAQRPHQLLVWGAGLNPDQPLEDYPPLEERALRQLSSAGGGHYLRFTVDKQDVRRIARRIDAHYVVTDDEAVPWLDSGYWLVFPCLLVFSLWFRKGWTLHWCFAPLMVLSLLQPQTSHASEHWFADLWLTPDQQGRLLLERGEYRQAASRFGDPRWKAVAYYYAEDFKLAAEYFSRVDTQSARFNRANALAQGQNYVLAVRLYDDILTHNPDHPAALQNRKIVQDIIDAINMMSESQADEAGSSSKELGEDDPQRADGAERQMLEQAQTVQFDAEQVIQDQKISDMWMRSVQRDPSHFLAVKFGMQLEASRQ